jgi:hypothetical protein
MQSRLEIIQAAELLRQRRLGEVEVLAAARAQRISEFVAACAEVADALRGKGTTPEVVMRASTPRRGILGITRTDMRVFAAGWTLMDNTILERPTVHTQVEEPMGLERTPMKSYRDVIIPGTPGRRWGVVLDANEGFAVRYDGDPGVVRVKRQPDGTVQKTVEVLNPIVEVLGHQASVDTVPLMERLADFAVAHEVLPD